MHYSAARKNEILNNYALHAVKQRNHSHFQKNILFKKDYFIYSYSFILLWFLTKQGQIFIAFE